MTSSQEVARLLKLGGYGVTNVVVSNNMVKFRLKTFGVFPADANRDFRELKAGLLAGGAKSVRASRDGFNRPEEVVVKF